MNSNQELPDALVDRGEVELSSDDLETVSGGEITPKTSASYDAGWVLTSMVKQVYDFGRGVYNGIMDDNS